MEADRQSIIVNVQQRNSAGLISAIFGIVFAVLGIFTIGFLFVPLAFLFVVIAFIRGISSGTWSSIGLSVVGFGLSAIGLFSSPALLLMLGLGGLASLGH